MFERVTNVSGICHGQRGNSGSHYRPRLAVIRASDHEDSMQLNDIVADVIRGFRPLSKVSPN
jgi:hypothetical protein